MAGLLGCEHTLLAHVELLVNHQHLQVLLLNPFSSQPVFVLGIAPTHVQDLALGLAEPHEVHTGPPLKPAQVPLDGIPALQCVDCTMQLGVVGKLAEAAISFDDSTTTLFNLFLGHTSDLGSSFCCLFPCENLLKCCCEFVYCVSRGTLP